MSWTDERIDRLKSLWTRGMTASQIADELGGVSRNAVIGKAHRLGLQSRPSPVRANEAGDELPPAAAEAPAPGRRGPARRPRPLERTRRARRRRRAGPGRPAAAAGGASAPDPLDR